MLAVPLQANLAVTITALPNPIAVNDTLTYVMTVTNIGVDAARSMVLTDTLPDSVQFLSVPAAPGPCAQIAGEGTTVVPIAGSGQLLPAFAPALQFSNYVGGQDAISEGPALAAASAHRKSSVTSMELSTHTPWPGAMVDVI